MPIRVLIAEDDPDLRSLFRAQVQTIPGFEVVGLAVDEDRAVGLCDELDPEIVLIGLDEGRGLAAAGARLKENSPRTKVLVVTSAPAPETELEGADMVLGRPMGTDRFVSSLLELVETA